MNGNQQPFFRSRVPGPLKSNSDVEQEFVTIEQKMRELFVRDNANINSDMVLPLGIESILTGGPPPAKPFPEPLQSTNNRQQINMVCN